MARCSYNHQNSRKWAIVLLLAWWLASKRDALATFKGVLLALLPVAIICVLIVKEDFRQPRPLIGLASIALLLAADVKWWHLAIVIPPAAAAGIFSVMHKSYRMHRMTAFLNP